MEKVVNVVGAGLAGLSATINLVKNGFKVNLISQLPSERAQSVLAEGGINAAINTMGENDTVNEHIEDTLKGGCFLASEKAVSNLCTNAPEIINLLRNIGVPFNQEDGHLVLRNFGGQKKKRTAFSKSSTGKMIMTALIDYVRKFEVEVLVNRYNHHALVDANIVDNTCLGITIKDLYKNKLCYLNGPVILATGGLAGFFPTLTTGTVVNDGSAATILFNKGIELANLEFIQYHPTTIAISGKRFLVTEAARGEGGRLFVYKNNEPYYFMEDRYPTLGNLMPRDVVSREEYKIVHEEGYEKIYLDMTSIKEDTWNKKLSDLRKEIIEYFNKDPKTTPIEVEPGIHFFMGGYKVNNNHETSINRLYAAGECAAIYHGANRLGGNSLLGALYGGLKAATRVNETYEYVESNASELNDFIDSTESFKDKLKDILFNGLSIKRDEEKINDAIKNIGVLRGKSQNDTDIKRINVALAMLHSAKARKESRGSHFRSDYPETLDEYKKTTVSKLVNNEIVISFESIDGE